MFHNKFKKHMYYLLKTFDKSKDIKSTLNSMENKFSLTKAMTLNVLDECIEKNYISGIHIGKSINNNTFPVFKNNVYLTLNGNEFIKNYYSVLKQVFSQISLAFIVATITLVLNNNFSNSKKEVIIDNKCENYSSENS